MQKVAGFLGITFGLMMSASSHAEAPRAQKISLEKRDTGTFYVPATLRGYGELELLVDTGSSYLVISDKILEKLKASGDAKFSRELSGTMADGRRHVVPLYRLSGLRLGEACWIENVEAAVLKTGSRAEATRPILGMNILSRLAPFTFSADPADLLLSQCKAKISADALAAYERFPVTP